MNSLEDLPNVGPQLAGALREAGITTPEELRRTGAIEAWQRIHPRFTCLHSLMALEGAVQGVPKKHLDDATRVALRSVVRE